MGPLPKNDGTIFWTNRGCDTDYFHPSRVGLPAVHHVYITPDQRVVGTDRQILDQSYSFCLKPNYETVSTRLFHWLITHPGVGVFLFWTRKRWLAQLATEKEKRLVGCVAGPGKCWCPLGNKGICIYVSCVFFLCFFLFVWKVWANLLSNFSPLLFFLVFARCCLWDFVFTFPLLPNLLVVQA